MPKYQYPGVYVEEVETGAHAIPGVDTPIDPKQLLSLVAAMRNLGIPRWTDFNESDPGVTLLELFAWVTEQLSYRANAISDRGRDVVLRAVAALDRRCISEREPLRRPDFFSGRLLDAATLREEQDYQRERLRRHNRALHGFGIVEGLGVHIDAANESGGPVVVIERGYAIDAVGEGIALPRGVDLALPTDRSEAYAALRHWDSRCPAALSPERTEAPHHDIEEACVVGLKTQVVSPWIALAHVTRSDGCWNVDSTFEPPRAR